MAAAARALPDLEVLTTGEWSARMVLAHIVFWHESFGRNVADLAAGRQPTPLRGSLAALGERTRAELGSLDVEVLLGRFVAAQSVIRRDVGAAHRASSSSPIGRAGCTPRRSTCGSPRDT